MHADRDPNQTSDPHQTIGSVEATQTTPRSPSPHSPSTVHRTLREGTRGVKLPEMGKFGAHTRTPRSTRACAHELCQSECGVAASLCAGPHAGPKRQGHNL